MHELGITQSILQIALHHANAAGAARVKSLNIVVGELASIVDDSVQFYWGMIAKDTIAEDAVLNFKRTPAQLKCRVCGHTFDMDRREFACPTCTSEQVEVAGGDEFFLESIDVDFDNE